MTVHTDPPATTVTDEEMGDLLEAVRSGDLSLEARWRLESVLIALIVADKPGDTGDTGDSRDDAVVHWAAVRGPWRRFLATWRETGRISEPSHGSTGQHSDGDLR